MVLLTTSPLKENNKMANTLTMQVKDREIIAKIIDVSRVQVIAPFCLACSHHEDYVKKNPKGHGCEKGLLGYDDRVCCSCDSYDGGSVLALDWKDGKELHFMLYPFRQQYMREMMEGYLEKISATGEVCEEDILGNITIKKYEVKNPTIL